MSPLPGIFTLPNMIHGDASLLRTLLFCPVLQTAIPFLLQGLSTQEECWCSQGYFGSKCQLKDPFSASLSNPAPCSTSQMSNDLTEPCYNPCPKGWHFFEKKCYYFSEVETDFRTARKTCEGYDATLATISSPAESYFIGLRSKKASAWLGLSDESSEQHWQWISSSPKLSEMVNTLGLLSRISARKAGINAGHLERTERTSELDQLQQGTAVKFSSWAMNQPSGAGDAAILYPYHWSFCDCEEYKRYNNKSI